jgi:O-antigen/teichoic acid export membrane protein
MLAGIGCWSVNEGITYYVSKVPNNVSTARAVAVLLSLITAIPGVIFFLIVFAKMAPDKLAPNTSLVQCYACFFIPFSYLSMNILAVEQGKQNFATFNLYKLLQPALYCAALAVVWTAAIKTVQAALVAVLASIVISAVARLAGCLGEMSLQNASSTMRLVARQSATFHLLNVFGYISNTLDQAFLALIASNQDLGYYVVATSTASAALSVLLQTQQTILFPRIAGALGVFEAKNEISAGIKRTSVWLTLALFPALLLIPILMPILYGAAFNPAIPLALILAVGNFPKAMRGVVGFCLKGTGTIMPQIGSEIAYVAVILSCGWHLYSGLRLLGIGILILVANTASLGVLGYYIQRRYKLSLIQMMRFNLIHDSLRQLRLVFSVFRNAGEEKASGNT